MPSYRRIAKREASDRRAVSDACDSPSSPLSPFALAAMVAFSTLAVAPAAGALLMAHRMANVWIAPALLALFAAFSALLALLAIGAAAGFGGRHTSTTVAAVALSLGAAVIISTSVCVVAFVVALVTSVVDLFGTLV